MPPTFAGITPGVSLGTTRSHPHGHDDAWAGRQRWTSRRRRSMHRLRRLRVAARASGGAENFLTSRRHGNVGARRARRSWSRASRRTRLRTSSSARATPTGTTTRNTVVERPSMTEAVFKTNVSFSIDVQGAIFANDCGVVGCHVPGSPTGGLILAPGFAYAQIVNVPNAQGLTKRRRRGRRVHVRHSEAIPCRRASSTAKIRADAGQSTSAVPDSLRGHASMPAAVDREHACRPSTQKSCHRRLDQPRAR